MWLKLLTRMTTRESSSQHPNQSSLLWLAVIRFTLVIAVVVYGVFQDDFTQQWLYSGLYLTFGGLLIWQQDHLKPQWSIAAGLVLDLLFIGSFLHSNDGLMSGWVSALLFPAVAGSLTCTRRVAWGIACIAMAVYGALVWGHLGEMLAAVPNTAHTGHNWAEHPQTSMSAHIQGMLITFCISVSLITGFISHQTEQVRRHQLTLNELREKQWRERQIMTFATLSANTAHRLASPVSTIGLLLEELDESDPQRQWLDPQLITQLQQQTQRCREALQSIAAIARNYDPENQRKQPINTWLTSVVEGWWVTRNEVQYQLQMSGDTSSFEIQFDENLNYALVNFLDNAADACQNASNPLVVISAHIDVVTPVLLIDIQDNGEGIPEAIAKRWGRQFIPSSGVGLGIGATLAHAAIEQLGGQVSLQTKQATAPSKKPACYIQIKLPVFE